MTDIREGKPSASSFDITWHCSGASNLLLSLPEDVRNTIDEPDEMALRGTRIHAAWETGNTERLSQDEIDDLERTKELSDSLKAKWINEIMPLLGEPRELRETRFWYNDPETLEPIASGQADLVCICGDHAHVQDLKSGWCRTLSPSEESWQLRLLAILVRTEFGVKHVRAAFIKPKFFKDSIDVVDYNERDLIQSESLFLHANWKSRQPDAQRTPGSWCRWCKAKPFCREAAAYGLLPATVTVNGKPLAIAEQLSVEQVCAFVKKKAIISKITEAIYTRAKTFTDEQLAANGLQRTEGRRLDPIVKVPLAFQTVYNAVKAKCSATSPTEIQNALWNTMTIGKGDLTDAVRGLTGETKKATEEWLRELLKPCIEEKRSQGSLEEI